MPALFAGCVALVDEMHEVDELHALTRLTTCMKLVQCMRTLMTRCLIMYVHVVALVIPHYVCACRCTGHALVVWHWAHR